MPLCTPFATPNVVMKVDTNALRVFVLNLTFLMRFSTFFEAENVEKLLIISDERRRLRRSASMSDSEIMTVLLLFHFGSFRNFKHYYFTYIKGVLRRDFPTAVSYNRFVEL